MTPELAYFLKINVAIALFYAFYRLFFHKDTFFHWRRMALLCFFAISMLYPLLNIQGWIKAHEPMVAMADLYATILLPEQVVTPTQETVINWQEVIMQFAKIIYWSGMLLLTARFFVQLGSIIRLHFQCSKSNIQGVRVHLLKKETGPFSFFHWIFIHPQSHTESEISEIITHEETHARQYHSVDVLFSEIMCIFCWFNPFIWLMKREVRGNLEYMADHRVLETGHDSKSYQYHLLGLAHHKAAANLSNSFNVLPLKNRIKMMNKRRTKEIGRTKYLMFLPLAGILMIVSNIEMVARTTEKFAKEMMAAPSNKPLLGLFKPGTMNVYIDREMLKNPEVLGKYTDQPNLVNMTKKSLDILSQNPKGFFAMIEGASIDKQLHAMDWQRATYDTIEFDKAIEYAQKWNKEHGDNTLIIVVADHAHGASITGTYHERDGKKGLAAVRTYADSIFPTFKDANHDGFPDNPDPDVTLAIQYANHPAYYENFHFQQKPTMPTITEKVTKQEAQQIGDKTEYHQVSTVVAKANPARHHDGDPVELVPANIPDTIGDECHAADDVPLNAEGPGSEYFNGVMDNTEVFFGIMRALGIDATKTVK